MSQEDDTEVDIEPIEGGVIALVRSRDPEAVARALEQAAVVIADAGDGVIEIHHPNPGYVLHEAVARKLSMSDDGDAELPDSDDTVTYTAMPGVFVILVVLDHLLQGTTGTNIRPPRRHG